MIQPNAHQPTPQPLHRASRRHVLAPTLLAAICLLLFLPSSSPPRAATLDPSLTLPSLSASDRQPEAVLPPLTGGLALRFKNLVVQHEIFSAFVLPGHDLHFEVLGVTEPSDVTVTAQAGHLEATGRDSWHWQAPEQPMLTSLRVTHRGGESRLLHLFVLTPYDGGDTLNGFKIGSYKDQPLYDLPAYRRPAGFVEVGPEHLDLQVSPHFRLGQFLCKQDSHFPKYLALQETLLLKLEALLDAARGRGMDVDTFEVMSGYRTPSYNRKIGNETIYSRHAYGDAADIFIDRDRNGRMDDLTGDGRVDMRDAAVLLELAREVERASPTPELVGGLGLYGPKKHRGPFLHVDARGFGAHWVKR